MSLTSILSLESSHSTVENWAFSKAESAKGSATPPPPLGRAENLAGARRMARPGSLGCRRLPGHPWSSQDVGAQADRA